MSRARRAGTKRRTEQLTPAPSEFPQDTGSGFTTSPVSVRAGQPHLNRVRAMTQAGLTSIILMRRCVVEDLAGVDDGRSDGSVQVAE